MIVKRIEWITQGYDLHLIPGAEIKPSLLKIHFDDGTENGKEKWASEIENSDNVKVKFDWRISPGRGANNIVTFSIQMDLIEGWIRVKDPPLNAGRLYNFIVEVKVTDNNTIPATFFESAIRIHLHESIKSAWLTPKTLSVREGTDSLRFSILAEFENQVADITKSVIGDIRYASWY